MSPAAPPLKRRSPCCVLDRVAAPCSACGQPVDDDAHFPGSGLVILCRVCCPLCGGEIAPGAA